MRIISYCLMRTSIPSSLRSSYNIEASMSTIKTHTIREDVDLRHVCASVQTCISSSMIAFFKMKLFNNNIADIRQLD